MPDEISIDKLREEYGEIAACKFSLDNSGPIRHGGKWVGDYQPGKAPLFSSLGEAPKIILSLLDIITSNNASIENQHKTIEQLKTSHDIAEKKLLRKVANAQSE